jgi:thiamine biosynthesis protein ThiS
MTVNGQPYSHRDGLTLLVLLDELRIDARRVAVMHGDDVHRPGSIPDTPLRPQDVVEIVTMMAGG